MNESAIGVRKAFFIILSIWYFWDILSVMYYKCRKYLQCEKHQVKCIQEGPRRIENSAVHFSPKCVITAEWIGIITESKKLYFSCLSSHDILFQSVSLIVYDLFLHVKNHC